MPKLEDHQSAKTTKCLIVGDPGSGKTGSLASLAAAGYNIRLIDLDNGADILANVLKQDLGGIYGKEALSRVHYQTITDKMKVIPGGKLVPAKATVWERTINLLNNWKAEGEDFGPIHSWTNKEVLVIDGLSRLSTAALDFIKQMNARLGQQAHQSDYFGAQQLIEGLLSTIADDNVRCNVVLISHIQLVENEATSVTHGYPLSVGKALAPKIGGYFNSILMAKSSGQGASAAKKLITSAQSIVELKNSNPGKVKKEYSVQTGLAEFFKDIQNG